MSAAFDRDALLDAFDSIGRAAGQAGTKLQIAVSVPSAAYLPALKLKTFRITDPVRGETERLDILNLMKVVGISTIEEAIALLGRYFPVSAASSEKQRFQVGAPQDTTLAEYVDTFDLAGSSEAQYEAIKDEPVLTQNARLDALVVAIAEPWFTTSSPSDAMREYPGFASPAEFASRNILSKSGPCDAPAGPRQSRFE